MLSYSKKLTNTQNCKNVLNLAVYADMVEGLRATAKTSVMAAWKAANWGGPEITQTSPNQNHYWTQ